MLSLEEDVEAQALRDQGWSISAIARHLGRDRKTIRGYLAGNTEPGRRKPAGPDPFEPYVAYCRTRLADDPHLWASTLLAELTDLGYPGGYSTFTRALRRHQLRPHCEPCQVSRGRDVAIIAHPPGEETQFDWVELPNPPAAWGVGQHAHLLVGALAHSSRWRGVLADAEDFPHLVEALDSVVRKLGGTTHDWRFDRMATVCYPSTGRLTAAFAQVAKHYGVRSVVCPPRRGNRKGVVEKANHNATEARRLAGRLRFACLPDPWTLSDFDFAAQPGVDEKLIRDLATLRFLDDASNVLFVGPPGVGKTMLTTALARGAAESGHRVYFTTAADLAARCHKAAVEGRWATCMRFFAGPKLLVIDELGYLPLPGDGASALFQVINHRYLKSSTILTTNVGIADWATAFGDATVAAAMLDRLLHRATVVGIDGPSYRLRSHQDTSDKLRKAVNARVS